LLLHGQDDENLLYGVCKIGFDLISTVQDNSPDRQCLARLRFSIFSWPKLLDLARSYGWQSAGTLPSEIYTEYKTYPELEPGQWDGTYMTNEGQIVTAEDATALANALEKALEAIPDHEGLLPKQIMLTSSAESREYIQASDNPYLKAFLESGLISPEGVGFPNVMLTPNEYFCGQEKQGVIDFIAFCRRGSFEIW
jgi:hypothetical protein